MKKLRKIDPSFDIPRKSEIGNHWNLTGYNPSPMATLMIKEVGGYINAVELARDMRFRYNYQVQDSILFHNKHFIQPNHRTRISVEYINAHNGTKASYTGQRKHKKMITWYDKRRETTNPETGELTNDQWFHMEARLRTKETVERWGTNIDTIHSFNHQEFWKVHLNYRDVNFDQIGMQNDVKTTGIRRRKPKIEKIGKIQYNYDKRNGYAFFVKLSVNENEGDGFSYEDSDPFHNQKYRMLSIQNLVDEYGLNERMFPKMSVEYRVNAELMKTDEKLLRHSE
jgi:hypothetical protein